MANFAPFRPTPTLDAAEQPAAEQPDPEISLLFPLALLGEHLPDGDHCTTCEKTWPCLYVQGFSNAWGVAHAQAPLLEVFLDRVYPNSKRDGETIFARVIRLMNRVTPLANRHIIALSPTDWSLHHPDQCLSDVESCAVYLTLRSTPLTGNRTTTRRFFIDILKGQVLLGDEIAIDEEAIEAEDQDRGVDA